jgi:hypothetical protein
VLMRLRFIMSEPESERAIDAAKLLVETVAAQADAKKDQIEINASASDSATIASLEIGLGIASALSRELLSKQTEPITPAMSFVGTLQAFVTLTAQSGEKKPSLGVPWIQILKPLAMLSDEGVLEAFLYHIGALGRAEGAVKWVNEHPEQMSKLAETINGYHARFTRQQMGAP